MRSQATKTLPKKGAISKTTLKTSTKQVNKRTVSPKLKTLAKKSLLKSQKKVSARNDTPTSSNDEEDIVKDKSKPGPELLETASKAIATRSDSPSKKLKKEPKEKKDIPKEMEATAKASPKKAIKTQKFVKVIPKTDDTKKGETKQSVKYKIKSELLKKANPKFIKSKSIAEKRAITQKTKKNLVDQDKIQEIVSKSCNDKVSHKKNNKSDEVLINNQLDDKSQLKCNAENKSEDLKSLLEPLSPAPSTVSSVMHETPKAEGERPHKFFTSIRSPRTVDIDVKCCKNSKGNLIVSERFLSTKCVDQSKTFSNNFISQGPEIDVYTFTDKVDSPRSTSTDYYRKKRRERTPSSIVHIVYPCLHRKKNVSTRKKYLRHRPIEEVVKLLKANKKTEALKATLNQHSGNRSSIDSSIASSSIASDDKDEEEHPQPIVSKSYKMVARKTSIPGKPFSPIKLFEAEELNNIKGAKSTAPPKKIVTKVSSQPNTISDEELDNSKFSFNTNSMSANYSSSDESASDDDNDAKESSESESPKTKPNKKAKKYKKITDSAKKKPCKELQELSKDSLFDLKDESVLFGRDKPSKRRMKLFSMWTGPKKHRMASLNAIAKVHCLYENESRTHMELGLMRTIDRSLPQGTSTKPSTLKKKETKSKESEKSETNSESDYEKKDRKEKSSGDDSSPPNTRSLRGDPGIRSAGKYWDPKFSTSSSEDSEMESRKKTTPDKKKATTKSTTPKSDSEKPPTKIKKTVGVQVKKKRNRNEVVMDLKDMVVQKRMASLNATAILAASYEKRSPKSSNHETTSDSCSDESFSQKSKNGVTSGVKSEAKLEEPKKEIDSDEAATGDKKQKVEVIVNQDTDVTITGVYSTHHREGFCTVQGLQYRISSTSHTQTTSTANCEKEGCPREQSGSRYTPLTALSSMQPPAEQHTHSHPVPELGGLARRAAGCSSAFSAPSPSAHHDPGKLASDNFAEKPQRSSPFGYYQPAGPLIKETGSDAERSLARYHPPPHYHTPHPPVLQQYGPYYPPELCYGRYYRQAGPYPLPPPPQTDSQMVGVGAEPYPPPQFYGAPPCYQHSPQRVPYIEYRAGCSCQMNPCPKNVIIGPATGKAPASGGPVELPALAPPGAAFRPKVRAACAIESGLDTHGSGKDPPMEQEPPAAADAPRPCRLPTIGGASPKREMYDVRDNMRLAGSAEAAGPPSPARGSAGACTPQPPPSAPRRARLGKAMARRSLAGDDTGLLMSTPMHPPPHHSDGDDDVLAISPPVFAPIDLSSSDELERRSTPLVDVKKENEGPTQTTPRKTDAQALREHNSSATVDLVDTNNAAKPVKRRYSRPKLEIEMRDLELDDSCKTNGIGEHVKLQKRRKVSSEANDLVNKPESIIPREIKKRTPAKPKNVTKPLEKKNLKRKLQNVIETTQNKKMNLETPVTEIVRVNVSALSEEQNDQCLTKSKTKSALLLDNLLRKNSIDRADTTKEDINPAKLFLTPSETHNPSKTTLNINNNVVDNNVPANCVRPKTIAAVSQHIGKKLAAKIANKIQIVESKMTQSIKSKTVLKSSNEKAVLKDRGKLEAKCQQIRKNKGDLKIVDTCATLSEHTTKNINDCAKKINDITDCVLSSANKIKDNEKLAPTKKFVQNKLASITESEKKVIDTNVPNISETTSMLDDKLTHTETIKKCKISSENASNENKTTVPDIACPKVGQLLVTKMAITKIDEIPVPVENICTSPITASKIAVRRARRRRSGLKKTRKVPALLTPPTTDLSRTPPKWSNGWQWDGEPYVARVFLNNDPRLDRSAHCWSRMKHASGDSIGRGDCVLLRASSAKAQPFVAQLASLWENPDDGEMMVSLVWYYRLEHMELGPKPEDIPDAAPDEVFSSRHQDANSVACIEDKCYVLTFNEYCRYRKRLKAAEEGIQLTQSIVPPMPASEIIPAIATFDSKIPPSVSPELVLFCRKTYDFRSKKIQNPNK